jgi:D-alanyl-D-alanine carboxypeptidase
LLGNVEGMDGIKTGYTQASGFNLVASVRRNNRHIVSVVMGGTSAGARDARMRVLIEEYITAATPQKSLVAELAAAKTQVGAARAGGEHTAEARNPGNTIAAKSRTADTRPADGSSASTTYSVASQTYPVASQGQPVPSPASRATQAVLTPGVAAARPPGIESIPAAVVTPTRAVPEPTVTLATDPIKPIQVKTVKVKMAPAQVAALITPAATSASAQIASEDASPDHTAPAKVIPSLTAPLEPKREPERDLIAEVIRANTPPQSEPRQLAPPAPQLHSGWIIQVGAFDVEREARQRLSAVQAKAGKILKHASPFTETVVMGDKTLYRARFAGIQKDDAEAICRQLKRSDIPCMTIKN